MWNRLSAKAAWGVGLSIVLALGGLSDARDRGGSFAGGRGDSATYRSGDRGDSSSYRSADSGRADRPPVVRSGDSDRTRWTPPVSTSDRATPPTAREGNFRSVTPPAAIRGEGRVITSEGSRRSWSDGASGRGDVRAIGTGGGSSTALSAKTGGPDAPAVTGSASTAGRFRNGPTISTWRSGDKPVLSGPASPAGTFGKANAGTTAAGWRGGEKTALGSRAVPTGRTTAGSGGVTWNGRDTSVAAARSVGSGSSRFGAVRSGDYFRDRRPSDRLPGGARTVHHGGHWYYHHHHHWWRPYSWYGVIWYWPVYPPVGYYYIDLPEGYTSVLYGGTTYYVADSVYYTTATDGTGYVVTNPPEGAAPVEASEMAPGAAPGPGLQVPPPPPADEGQDPDDTPEAALAAPALDPFDVLKRMADYNRALPRLTVRATDSFEDGPDKARTTLNGRMGLFLERPDRFALECRGDLYDRDVFFDGKNVTVLDVRRNAVARAGIPASISGMLDTMARRHGISMPLADLLACDYRSLAAPVLTGQYVGLERVGPNAYHHLAFAEDTVDWEVWVDAGSAPVVRRYVITYKLLPNAPQYAATVLTLDAGAIPEARFTPAVPPVVLSVDLPVVAP